MTDIREVMEMDVIGAVVLHKAWVKVLLHLLMVLV